MFSRLAARAQCPSRSPDKPLAVLCFARLEEPLSKVYPDRMHLRGSNIPLFGILAFIDGKDRRYHPCRRAHPPLCRADAVRVSIAGRRVTSPTWTPRARWDLPEQLAKLLEGECDQAHRCL